jgi:LuxR family maltose regulon positive regulatory protein
MTSSTLPRPLATRLAPPRSGTPVVRRPRLSELADGLLNFRLALVVGPAGSGKTTVMTDWHEVLHRNGVPVAWLSLGPGDVDPRRLLSDMAAAVGSIVPEFASAVATHLSDNPELAFSDLLPMLIDGLLDRRSPLALFLDDFHEVADPAIHRDISLLLRYLPAECVVVVGTRARPGLPLGRLRARGQLLEVDWAALRFTSDETRAYLTEQRGLELSDDQLDALERRTEGWITGYQLVSLSLRQRPDPDRLAAAISGSQLDIAEYLLDEVYRQQRPEIQAFLRRSSVLDRLSASLCDAVTLRRDSQAMLETLDRLNLFIFRLDDESTWFRYHAVFAEFLRQRARAEEPDGTAGLHLRASVWFERNGQAAEALRHALMAGATEPAAELLEADIGGDLFHRGDLKALHQWIEQLPADALATRPRLCLLHTWALAYLGEFAAARRQLALAEAALERSAGADPLDEARRAECQVLRFALSVIQTDEPDLAGLSADIVGRLPAGDGGLRAFAEIMLGYASRASGDLSRACAHFDSAAELSRDGGGSLPHLLAHYNMAGALLLMGRIHEMEDVLRESVRIAFERHWRSTIGCAFVHVALAVALREQNRLDEAKAEVDEAIDILEATQAHGFLGVALVERGRILLGLGSLDRARAALSAARALAARHGAVRVAFRADLVEARAALLAGDFAGAASTVSRLERGVAAAGSPGERTEAFLIEAVRLHCAEGKYIEAIRLASEALRSSRSAARERNTIELLALQAASWARLGDAERGRRKLEEALARPAGEAVIGSLLVCRDGALQLAGLDGLHGRVGRSVIGVPKLSSRPPLPALHHRELQILQLVADGLRNREIAERLRISEETVKWYLKRLFGKFDVASRTQAVAHGRELGLIA